MKKILELYRNEKTFTCEQNDLIDNLIDRGDIETEDLRVDFKEWVYENYPEIEIETLWDFDEYYNNGLTHKKNFKNFLEFNRQFL